MELEEFISCSNPCKPASTQ